MNRGSHDQCIPVADSIAQANLHGVAYRGGRDRRNRDKLHETFRDFVGFVLGEALLSREYGNRLIDYLAAGNRHGIENLACPGFHGIVAAQSVDHDIGINEGRHGRRVLRVATYRRHTALHTYRA